VNMVVAGAGRMIPVAKRVDFVPTLKVFRSGVDFPGRLSCATTDRSITAHYAIDRFAPPKAVVRQT
jgi:hypothetical protein